MALFRKKQSTANKKAGGEKGQKASRGDSVSGKPPAGKNPTGKPPTGKNPTGKNPTKEILIRKALAKVGNPLPEGGGVLPSGNERPGDGRVDLEDMSAKPAPKPKPKMYRDAILRDAFDIMNDPEKRAARARKDDGGKQKPQVTSATIPPAGSSAPVNSVVAARQAKIDKIAVLLKTLKQPPVLDEVPSSNPPSTGQDSVVRPPGPAVENSPARAELLKEAMAVRASQQHLLDDIDQETRDRLSQAVFKKMNLTLEGE